MVKKKEYAYKGKDASAIAIHACSDDGKAHAIGIGNLRVMITTDDGSWFAQGLEIDYAAQGDSLEEVKANFQNGLAATIDEHLQIYGNVEKLLKPAPAETWVELFKAARLANRYSQVSVRIHEALPFEEIIYFEKKAA